jgi:predicted dehydrogenase
VATPDHWHVPISLAAVKAGKDVYCEKPLTLTIAEGRTLSDAARRYRRVFQTGSQQRSDRRFRLACELVRNGRIGELHTINVEIPPNSRQCPPTWKEMPIPPGFDYEMWLGPAQYAPYTEQRCHYSFRFIMEYSGGQVTNWGAHDLDIAQWALDADNSGPIEISGQGEFPREGLFSTATQVHIEYTYANGVKLVCDSGGNGVTFHGSEGWIYVWRDRIIAHPQSLLSSMIGPGEVHLYQSDDHIQNFLDCFKTRQTPAADVEIGHRSATVCHLGNIAMLRGRRLRWNPQTEQFANDEEANRLLSRPARCPW